MENTGNIVESNDNPIQIQLDPFNTCVNERLYELGGSFLPTNVSSAFIDYATSGDYTNSARELIKFGFRRTVVGLAAEVAWITFSCTWQQEDY